MVIGKTLDVFDALLAQSSPRQHIQSHVCTRRRQPPIVVNRRSVRTSIRMSADDDGTRTGLENLAYLSHDLDGFWLRFGGTNGKHRIVCIIGQTDEDAFRAP